MQSAINFNALQKNISLIAAEVAEETLALNNIIRQSPEWAAHRDTHMAEWMAEQTNPQLREAYYAQRHVEACRRADAEFCLKPEDFDINHLKREAFDMVLITALPVYWPEFKPETWDDEVVPKLHAEQGFHVELPDAAHILTIE